MAHTLPELGYAYDALEPHIDARTMEIHHSKHHQAYITNLNNALAGKAELEAKSLCEIIGDLASVPEDIRTAVRNNGGGVYNHDLYWKSMSPNAGGKPIGTLGVQIDKTFGDFEAFKTAFEKAGLTRFGSGYAWLSARADASLVLHSTANQDSPVQENLKPLLVVDVWEHAYYLNYQNRRADYLSHWWEVVDWQGAEKRYLAIK